MPRLQSWTSQVHKCRVVHCINTSSVFNYAFLAGVLVSFAQATYLADEGQGTIEVCLSLTGQLDRNLNVTISTISGSATGV